MASLEEQSELYDDVVLLSRVRAAVFHAVKTIGEESPAVTNHQDRVRWTELIRGVKSDNPAAQILRALVTENSGLTKLQIQELTDPEIQDAVDAVVDAFAG